MGIAHRKERVGGCPLFTISRRGVVLISSSKPKRIGEPLLDWDWCPLATAAPLNKADQVLADHRPKSDQQEHFADDAESLKMPHPPESLPRTPRVEPL